jgi:Acetyltransferase (GNAT) domain
MPDAVDLTVRVHEGGDDASWNAFVAASPNGCLFQDLTFLGYHPPGRFDFRHLQIRRGGTLVAVMPGGLTAERIYRSPLGASTGGPAFLPGLDTDEVCDIVGALQRHALNEGWRGIEITLPPAPTLTEPTQIIELALRRSGFALAGWAMSFVVPLTQDPAASRGRDHETTRPQGDDPQPSKSGTLFRQKHRTAARAGRRHGIVATEHGVDALPAFLEVFADTYRRHDTAPTHTPEEIRDLMQRLPDRVRLWLAHASDVTVAGALLFHLNARTAYAFYICDLAAYRHMNGTTTLMAALIDALAERGLSQLDLGPSASDRHFNAGVIRFKEGIGARPFCRDTYHWTASHAAT